MADLQGGKDVAAKLTTHNLKWQETSEFNLSDTHVPGIGNNTSVLEAAYALRSNGKLYDKTVTVRDNFYLIRLKERKAA